MTGYSIGTLWEILKLEIGQKRKPKTNQTIYNDYYSLWI